MFANFQLSFYQSDVQGHRIISNMDVFLSSAVAASMVNSKIVFISVSSSTKRVMPSFPLQMILFYNNLNLDTPILLGVGHRKTYHNVTNASYDIVFDAPTLITSHQVISASGQDNEYQFIYPGIILGIG